MIGIHVIFQDIPPALAVNFNILCDIPAASAKKLQELWKVPANFKTVVGRHGGRGYG
jgi:hypothetical protein